MKKLIATALLSLMAMPAFANEAQFDTQNLTPAEEMVQVEEGMALDQGAAFDENLTQPWRRPVTCFARDVFGRTYYGRDWSPRRAQRLALNTCLRYGGFVCRALGCRGGRGRW